MKYLFIYLSRRRKLIKTNVEKIGDLIFTRFQVWDYKDKEKPESINKNIVWDYKNKEKHKIY